MGQTRLRLRLRALAVAVAAASLLGAGPAPGTPAPAAPAGGRLTDLVDPFTGTLNEGNAYPGAAVPFGMVQLSPDTGHNTGYDYSQDHIRGFSAVHLSGVGCGSGGELPVLPTTGDITSTDDARYAAAYSHDGESASPGHYKVRLTSYGGITAELTATARTGRQRYAFPATDKANVLLDSGQALHHVTSSSVTVDGDRTVRASITGDGFCYGTRPYTVHTVTRFDRPFASFGTWRGTRVSAGSRSSHGGGLGGAYVRFDTTGGDRDVVATTAVSYVSEEGARRNLAAEGGGGFGATVDAARRAWEDRLSRVRVRGGGDERRRTFYSALYRAFLAPNLGQDADGRYLGWDGRAHTAKGFTYYQNWSLWDTYRTQQQLLALLAPRESRDMALSLLRVADEGGWLPKWGYGTVETNVMTGDPVTPFLADAFQQGLLKGHEEEAYRALTRNADRLPPAGSPYAGREGAERYAADGFVPQDPAARPPGKPGDCDFEHGGSATLEYALADAALGRMARDLGHRADARRYLERGQYYRNLLDPATRFFRARDGEGLFTGSPDPADSAGFHEGTAWQYMWLVPQDLPDLVRLIGGRREANRRLDSFFAYDRLVRDPEGTARNVWINGPYDYYDADRYNPQNEPDLLAPYTYLSTGQPWKTTDVVHAALTLFRDTPDGITGNDDLGTMSSWAVLSSIGLYPVVPGSTVWGLSTPVFERVDLALDRRYYPGGHLTITAPGTSGGTRYVRSLRVGGRAYGATWITGADIAAGRDVAFSLGTSPSGWGTRAGDAPPALDRRAPAQHRLSAGVRPAEAGVVAGSGEPARLTVSTVFTQPGRVDGRVEVSVPAPLSADPKGARFTLRPDGLPATREVGVRVTVPKGTADGSYPVTVRVSDSHGASVTRTAHIRVVTAACTGRAGFCPQDLANAYGTDGVSTRDSGQGDFDGTGFGYPAEAMPGAGLAALGGVAYRFPDTSGTAPNFVTARGQTLPLTRRPYAALDLLVAAHHGPAGGTATVTYADGGTARVPLVAADWAAGTPSGGGETAVRADSRYGPRGAPDGVAVRLWHTSLPLDPGREAVSVTLPDQPRLLVYAMSGRDG
jgi:predicted alpha-1,2-mannosidase